MSDNKEILAMVKELDLIAASLEEAAKAEAPEKQAQIAELVDRIDQQSEKLSCYYTMDDMYMDEGEDVVDDSAALADQYNSTPMMQKPAPAPAQPAQPPVGGPGAAPCRTPMMQKPPMGGPGMPPACKTPPMLQDQTTMPNPGLQVPSLPGQTTVVDPSFPAPGLPGSTQSTMPVAPMMEDDGDDMGQDDVLYTEEDDYSDDDMYGDDDVMDYEEDMVFAEVVASVASKLAARGEDVLSDQVRALLNQEE